jgi:hypothetical protein
LVSGVFGSEFSKVSGLQTMVLSWKLSPCDGMEQSGTCVPLLRTSVVWVYVCACILAVWIHPYNWYFNELYLSWKEELDLVDTAILIIILSDVSFHWIGS